MAYTIMINEHQRAMLVSAAKAGSESLRPVLSSVPSDYGDESAFADLQNLLEMLVELPSMESVDPGATHGLCL